LATEDATPPACVHDEITDTLWFAPKVSNSGGAPGKGPPPPDPPSLASEESGSYTSIVDEPELDADGRTKMSFAKMQTPQALRDSCMLTDADFEMVRDGEEDDEWIDAGDDGDMSPMGPRESSFAPPAANMTQRADSAGTMSSDDYNYDDAFEDDFDAEEEADAVVAISPASARGSLRGSQQSVDTTTASSSSNGGGGTATSPKKLRQEVLQSSMDLEASDEDNDGEPRQRQAPAEAKDGPSRGEAKSHKMSKQDQAAAGLYGSPGRY
jgi:hypothetical protein